MVHAQRPGVRRPTLLSPARRVPTDDLRQTMVMKESQINAAVLLGPSRTTWHHPRDRLLASSVTLSHSGLLSIGLKGGSGEACGQSHLPISCSLGPGSETGCTEPVLSLFRPSDVGLLAGQGRSVSLVALDTDGQQTGGPGQREGNGRQASIRLCRQGHVPGLHAEQNGPSEPLARRP